MKILYLPNQYSQQRQREKARWIYPVLLAMEAEYHRLKGDSVQWGPDKDWMFAEWKVDKIIREPEGLPFLELPPPDRFFTKAFDPRYQENGNFKYHPGTYIQVANGCWHGKCSFCVERNVKWEVRDVDKVIDEIDECRAFGFKEVFDDSGTFPTGRWLYDFCYKFRKFSKYSKTMRISCNMRMVDVDYDLMYRVGFRMVLFGLESANQKTLDRINKGVKVEDHKYIIKAAKAGLEPHIAVMFGYSWEDDSDALRTLELVWRLLRSGYAKTAQASFYTVPGEKSNERQRGFPRRIYSIARSPVFWINKIRDIRNIADLKYFWRQIKEGLRNVQKRP